MHRASAFKKAGCYMGNHGDHLHDEHICVVGGCSSLKGCVENAPLGRTPQGRRSLTCTSSYLLALLPTYHTPWTRSNTTGDDPIADSPWCARLRVNVSRFCSGRTVRSTCQLWSLCQSAPRTIQRFLRNRKQTTSSIVTHSEST